jgi:hypothetical protein
MAYEIKSLDDFNRDSSGLDQTQEALQPKSEPYEIKNLSDFNQPTAKSTSTEPQDDYMFDPEETLKKDDLKTGQRARVIRQHMIDRHGVDYDPRSGKSDDEVVEDFVDNMRWMNSNTVSVASEVRFIHDADDGTKKRAGDAYKIYDQLGNVFTNDGFTGAVDGIKDYLFAAVADPSNYIGILTGGIGKASGIGLTQAGRLAVKKAAIEAGQQAVKKGATQEAAKVAGENAAKQAAKRFTANNVKTAQSKELRRAAARRERDIFLTEAKKKAQRDSLRAASLKDGKKILAATTAADASFAMLHDVTLQSTLLQAGAQEEYSILQTGFSSLLGGVGGLAQLGFGKLSGASGLTDTDLKLRMGAERKESSEKIDMAIDQFSSKEKRIELSLDEGQTLDASDVIKEAASNWRTKVKRGKDAFDDVPTSIDFLSEVMLGTKNRDGTYQKNGLVQYFKDQGKPLPKGVLVSDVMTTIATRLPQAELKEINELMKPMSITLGDTAQWGQKLGDLLAVEISKGGQALNVMSQVRKQIDAASMYGHQVIDNSVASIEALDEAAAKAKRTKGVLYGQNIWRRLLVSSPATTAINVMGFGQFYIGQSLADVFSSTGHFMAGMAKGGPMTKEGRESLRVANVYRSIQTQKIRNLMDPHTTHDAYMAFLKQDSDVSKILFESFTGGVDRSAGRFGMDPDAKWFQRTEATVDAMNSLTGVKIQDSFTKSQMFITEMDKYVRLNNPGRTLSDVLEKGDIDIIDNEVMGSALDTTLKSVFSKDYTTDDQLMGNVAKQVEQFSNIPLVGTILPFGRFLNNVIATSYQWSIGGGIAMTKAMYKKTFEGVPVPKDATEAFSRSLVGMTALRLAMEQDDTKREKNLPWHHMDVGGGKTMDGKNLFPASLWMAVGRAANLSRNGEMVPQDLLEDIGAQIAVGQFAKDAQFANDFYNIFDTLFNAESGDRKASMDAVYKQGGNILAGFTRPLDAVNRMVGFINDTDAARDARQQTGIGVGIMGSTKYVDNIIEIFTDKLENVTGEELRVMTREGSLKDASPLLRIMGVTILPARTGTEKAYSMAEAHTWKGNERSQVPAYDKALNTIVAPLLEERMQELTYSPSFVKGSVTERRRMIKDWRNGLVKEFREYMSKSEDYSLDSLRKKATTIPKDLKFDGMKAMKEAYNFEGSIKDMNWEELQYFMTITDYYADKDKRGTVE